MIEKLKITIVRRWFLQIK